MPYPPQPPLRRTTTDLPIEAAQGDLAAALEGDSLVLTAEPGAGKSSLVPIAVADAVGDRGCVVVLEPRRLAAMATAQRLSGLLEECSGIGDLVGLTMRGTHKVSERTRVEVVTEAILTARLQRDPELDGVAALVFDEFHERNLHSDLSLAMALESRAALRPDLKIVIMSATLESDAASNLLGSVGAPAATMAVPGRTFAVETIHLPRPETQRWASAVADATTRALSETAGDVLVFVPGRREISQVTRALAPGTETIGLHGGAGAEVQRRILAPETSGQRRVIVATAVAETSVTLPGITAVVDGGLLRRAIFDPGTGLGRLETRRVTRFAADQRRGRAGRLGPGRCYRLWSVEDHRHLDDAVPPEVTDGDPLPLAFELLRWGDPTASNLPLLDHPGQQRLLAGRRLLESLGLARDDRLTPDGLQAAKLGTHPRSAALLLESARRSLVALGTKVVALMEDDRFATSTDLGAELEQRWRELGRPATRLARRLESGSTRNGSTRDGSTERGGGQPQQQRAQLSELALLLAAAWPDRIGMRRASGEGRFLLANGREVEVPATDPLAGHEFIVAVEADGAARSARLRRGVGLDRATVLEALTTADPDGLAIEWIDAVEWDDRDDIIRSERQQRIGAIVLHRSPLPAPSPSAVTAALASGLARRGLDLLRWTDRATNVRLRLAWLHQQDPSAWPPVDDTSLLERRDEWLDLSGCASVADVRRLEVGDRLLNLLAWDQRQDFERLAPTGIAVPGGEMRRLDYSAGRPVWSVRIQHLFGLDSHPQIGPNQEPVTIALLSPANRPAQMTNDLPGFWRGSYAGVRADLRGRYPKHAWPERPWELG